MQRRLLWPFGWRSVKMMGIKPAGRGERKIGWSVGFGEEEKACPAECRRGSKSQEAAV